MTLLLCTLIFLLAGLTKGLLGLGLPTVAMSLLALLMTPTEAAALLLIPSLLTNVWQFCAGPAPWQSFRRLLPLQLALVPGTLLSIPLLTRGDGAWQACGWASACAYAWTNTCSVACSLVVCCCWVLTPSCIICCAWAILAEPVTVLCGSAGVGCTFGRP